MKKKVLLGLLLTTITLLTISIPDLFAAGAPVVAPPPPPGGGGPAGQVEGAGKAEAAGPEKIYTMWRGREKELQ